jgi:elongation factor G
VGPYSSGKTTLLESLLALCGAVTRRGTIKDGNTVGDGSAEARARQTSTELSVASARYLDESWTFLDCPGSVELIQDAYNALMVVDTAVVVCEAEPQKSPMVAPLLRFLDMQKIPHVLFINKMDTATASLRETLEALQSVSQRPLVLREIPIRDDDKVTGFIDLVSERAFRWAEGKRSELISVPEAVVDRERQAREELLETIADFDDALLEKLLEETVPPADEIYSGLGRDLQNDLIVPVFFGSAEGEHGITRLMKALRHEAPTSDTARARLGLDDIEEACGSVFKTVHAAHTGKQSYVRVWSGEIADGMTVNGERPSGISTVLGQKMEKISKAGPGDVVALGRLENVATGALVSASGSVSHIDWPAPLNPLFALAIRAKERADEVKLSTALTKIIEEDPSLSFGHEASTGEMLLWGQGEVQLTIALERFANRFNVQATGATPQVPYKETIRKPVSQHARHKKQSGGHGEFGDVHVDIAPLPRGSGFAFQDTITGGAVPKQYIPAVEAGIREYLAKGPLGFPVVDVATTLTDGQFHTVDSSEMAFRKAAQLAMREGMPKCGPVLLEPIFTVKVAVPTEFTSRIQRIVSGRRGQILGFEPKEGWTGWDEVSALLPQSETHGLIIELRSVTMGVGTFEWEFDHLQEISGRLADEIVAAQAS